MELEEYGVERGLRELPRVLWRIWRVYGVSRVKVVGRETRRELGELVVELASGD